MSRRLEGPDRRYFEIVPHADVKGENVLAEYVASISAGWVRVRDWDFATVDMALRQGETDGPEPPQLIADHPFTPQEEW